MCHGILNARLLVKRTWFNPTFLLSYAPHLMVCMDVWSKANKYSSYLTSTHSNPQVIQTRSQRGSYPTHMRSQNACNFDKSTKQMVHTNLVHIVVGPGRGTWDRKNQKNMEKSKKSTSHQILGRARVHQPPNHWQSLWFILNFFLSSYAEP